MTPKQTEDLLLSLKPQETAVYKYTEPVNPSPDAGSSPAGGHLDDKELISADGDAVQEIKTPETETVMLPGIILGRSLADELSVSTGDVIEVISLRERISPLGGLPHIKRFQVRGIFISGLSGYDETLAFTDLETAQKFFFRSKAVSGISVFLDNPDDAVKYQEKLQETFTFPYYVRSWIEDNANLFAVIALEKVGLSGTVIGLSGTIIGEIAGLLICLVIKNYEVVKIPEGVYVANKIPLYINGLHLLLIGVVSMIICFAVTVYPSTKAARYAPAENLRND
ncbi:hypothetical protein CHS0354_018441 [Potamilus streckersoni]|uniref:Uncharacterized protein n=1 Tax=Potamilus streckersoni TaxID=2493646 RepID=A0AAE0TAL8_9BIVA|nr:hypothetical protein CHS0354_018441 [Potamilus streckersoni]